MRFSVILTVKKCNPMEFGKHVTRDLCVDIAEGKG